MNQPWQTRFHYDGNGNVQRLYRNGPEIQNGSWKMDSLRYHYDAHKNSLRHVDDSPTLTSHYDTDIDDQNPLNYTYDAVGRMVKDNLSDILRVKWNRMSKPTEIWRTAKPVIRYYFGPDGAKVATFDGSTRVDYVHDPSGQLMAVYETVERGDSVVLPTLNPEGKFLRAVLAGLSDTCEVAAERFMARYITPDCKIGSDSQIMYELGRLSCLGYETISYLSPHVNLSCVGMNIQQSRDFPIDTTATGVVIGTRFSQQWLTEQHLYGSARLGIDRERRLLADSVQVRRAVFNPIVGWWKEVSIIKPLALVYRSDTSARQADTLGAVHFELPNHLGNVVAVVSDRKIAVDTLSPLLVKYYPADRIFLRDYYAFGMTMPGRQWAMDSSYRFGFNGKENLSIAGWQDYGMRFYDTKTGRFFSPDPLIIREQKYAELSAYQFASNSPIAGIDLDGLEIMVVHFKRLEEFSGKSLLDVPENNAILYKVTLSIQYLDGTERVLNAERSIVAFENKEFQLDRLARIGDFGKVSNFKPNALKVGIKYSLEWRGFKYTATNDENTLHIKSHDKTHSNATFIHPSSGTGQLNGCKGICFEDDADFGIDKDGRTMVVTRPKGYYGHQIKNSQAAAKEIRRLYEENEHILEQDDSGYGKNTIVSRN